MRGHELPGSWLERLGSRLLELLLLGRRLLECLLHRRLLEWLLCRRGLERLLLLRAKRIKCCCRLLGRYGW